jgi:hypothetical protein
MNGFPYQLSTGLNLSITLNNQKLSKNMETKYSKIEWGCFQKKGIKLITPNEILGRSYLEAAQEDLKEMQSKTLRIQNSAAYNACYNSFYAILQKMGIKCEISDCTLEFFSLIPGFSQEQIDLIKLLRQNNLEIEEHIRKARPVIQEPVIEFVETAKEVFESLSQNKIRLVRGEISLLIKKHRDR